MNESLLVLVIMNICFCNKKCKIINIMFIISLQMMMMMMMMMIIIIKCLQCPFVVIIVITVMFIMMITVTSGVMMNSIAMLLTRTDVS